ncbi:MAG TPA: Sua5/YciO/YrdC/YwlC family protein, partial [Thermoplasmata archaeon]|nr:Sua5/YciO/YrdC/YwlC family protein [Thermoplasmata archaeon]
ARTGPLTTTSANRHGKAPCRTATEARRTFGPAVGAYLSAGDPPSGRPSTIVALTGPHARLVRRS